MTGLSSSSGRFQSSAKSLTRPSSILKLRFMLYFGPVGDGPPFDPLLLLLMALVLDACIGEPRLLFRVVPHPVVMIGSLIGALDRKLNRENRSNADRIMRGALTVLIVCAAVGGGAWFIGWLTRTVEFGWIVEIVLIAVLLAQRSLYRHVRAVACALREGGLEAGRRAVSHIVGRDVNQLDRHGVARAAIESCAENFADAVVAPVFWYVMFGFPGLAVYKAVNTMDSMIGHRNPRYHAFGMTAARLDDALNFIPARLAGFFLSLAAAFVPTANPVAALGVMTRDGRKHRSINAGWPEGAMAGALGLALAGPRRYGDTVIDDPWIGDGRAPATDADITRALSVYAAGCLINALVVAVLVLVR